MKASFPNLIKKSKYVWTAQADAKLYQKNDVSEADTCTLVKDTGSQKTLT